MNDNEQHLKTLKALAVGIGHGRTHTAILFAISAIERSRWVAVEIGEKPDAVDFQTEYLVSVDGHNGNQSVCLATYHEEDGWRDVQTDAQNEPIRIERDYGPVTAYREVPRPYEQEVKNVRF